MSRDELSDDFSVCDWSVSLVYLVTIPWKHSFNIGLIALAIYDASVPTKILITLVMLFSSSSSKIMNRNVRRLQNMILAIGPGTPASCVLSSIPSADGGGAAGGDDHDSVSSNDEDDIYNADSNEEGEEEEDIEMLEEEWREGENDDYVDSEDDGKEEEESETNSHFRMGPSSTHVGEDEGFRLDDKKSLDETTPKSHEDIHASDDDQREVETEIARKLAARPHESERNAEDSQEHQQRGTGQRTAWTRRTIGNALPAAGNDYDGVSNNTHMDSDLEDSSEETAHMNESRARQAGQVIEFLHNQIIRQQRRLRRSQHQQPVSTASRRSNLQPPQQYEREVARSMKHSGCINTACWLDCGWRISTVSHEDAHPYERFYNKEFITSDSHSSNDNHLAPSWQRSSYNNGLAVLSSPSEYPTQLITSGKRPRLIDLIVFFTRSFLMPLYFFAAR